MDRILRIRDSLRVTRRERHAKLCYVQCWLLDRRRLGFFFIRERIIGGGQQGCASIGYGAGSTASQ